MSNEPYSDFAEHDRVIEELLEKGPPERKDLKPLSLIDISYESVIKIYGLKMNEIIVGQNYKLLTKTGDFIPLAKKMN